MAVSTLIRTVLLMLFMAVLFIKPTSADVKLVLIGVAFQKDEVTPLSDAKIELVDVKTEETKAFVTKEDGRFYFKLDVNRSYKLSLIGKNGLQEDNRLINTESKPDPQVLRTTLSSSGKGIQESISGNYKPYSVPRSEEYAKPNR